MFPCNLLQQKWIEFENDMKNENFLLSDYWDSYYLSIRKKIIFNFNDNAIIHQIETFQIPTNFVLSLRFAYHRHALITPTR